MRFRLTIILLLANAALFYALWYLERTPTPTVAEVAETVPFTVLEISGKTIDKPRVLKLENGKWRIVSPINWPANLFAINRIRTQIEFLDKDASFSLSEAQRHGHTLAEYGLDDPSYTLRYGNGKKMYSLKIGKSAPVGDRIYMLDENGDRIVVVDKAFVDGVVVDAERLRAHNIFDIPRFEVSSFSVRLPAGGADGKPSFKRVGLIRDASKWKFETPIVAAADTAEVESFLNEICGLSAKSFPTGVSPEAAFDISALPTTISVEGTNRRQTMIAGDKTKDGSLTYARIDGNPTIFTVDSAFFEKLKNIQTVLRDRTILRFDIEKIGTVDISRNGKKLKLGKLKSGVWDVVGEGAKGETLTAPADAAAVNSLLIRLSRIRVLEFVSDAAGDNTAQYGIGPDSLKISATQPDGVSYTLTLGSEFKRDGVRLMYARADGSDAVYAVSCELAETASTDFLRYRSRIIFSLPEKAVLNTVKLTEIGSKKPLFELTSANGDFAADVAKLRSRKAAAARKILSTLKSFAVAGFVSKGFDPKGVNADGSFHNWKYELELSGDISGTGKSTQETKKFFFTRRIGGTTQFGGEVGSASFALGSTFIDALFEVSVEGTNPPALQKPVPSAPDKKPIK